MQEETNSKYQIGCRNDCLYQVQINLLNEGQDKNLQANEDTSKDIALNFGASDNYFDCPKCPAELESKIELTEHISSHEDEIILLINQV